MLPASTCGVIGSPHLARRPSEPSADPLRDTWSGMKESTTPDLVELWRQAAEATNRRDLDVVMSLFDPDAVWESRAGTFEGAAAVRSFLEDWFGNYEDMTNVVVEGRDLGSGVVFAEHRQD